jgi:hypothetical protein
MLPIALALSLGMASTHELPRPMAFQDVAVVGDEHGKLPWFKGSWEELLAEARRTGSLIFIDFWAET